MALANDPAIGSLGFPRESPPLSQSVQEGPNLGANAQAFENLFAVRVHRGRRGPVYLLKRGTP